MNRTHSRSATPVMISIINSTNSVSTNYSLVGFVPKSSPHSKVKLYSILRKVGVAKTNAKNILKHANRQLLWDYLNEIFVKFLQRQDDNKGFHVQIGTGVNAQWHLVHFIVANMLGDHPQIHDLCGINRSACHVCVNKNPSNFPINDCDMYYKIGTERDRYQVRDPRDQHDISKEHYNRMSQFIMKKDGYMDEDVVDARMHIKCEASNKHAYSGDIHTYSLFEQLLDITDEEG